MDHSIFNLFHLSGCILLLIFSFLIIAPLSVVVRNFNGTCLIGVEIITKNHTPIVADDSASMSPCGYGQFMGAMILLYSIAYSVWNGCLLFSQKESTWRECFIGTTVSSVLLLMLMISASVLTHDLSKTCSAIGNDTSYLCDYVNYRTDKWLMYKNPHQPWNVHTTTFFTLFKISEVSSWLAFVVLTVCAVLYFIKLRISSHGESFMSNLNRERENILTRANQRRYDQI